jgi:3-oxoacyl-[acyl-carrier protein] reductase
MGGVNLPGLRGKTAVVTGASRGVGAATALLLARCGVGVALGYRSRDDEAASVVREVRALGVDGVAVRGDLAREESAAALFDAASKALGGVDFFVGNAGVWPPEDVPLSRMETGQWRHTLAANLDSIFFTTREAARQLRPGGSVVLVSSTAGQRGEAFHADYAATKGALISLVKGLCVELAPRGIRVNAVAPGWIDTEMVAGALAGEAGARAASGIPLGRIASADDVAGPIVFLCSELARHVTGEILNVNGGSVLVG